MFLSEFVDKISGIKEKYGDALYRVFDCYYSWTRRYQ